VLVNWGKSQFSDQFPSQWTYALGALFVVVVAFAPRGLAGISADLRGGALARWRSRGHARPAEPGVLATEPLKEAAS
jgi:urea transport system permease protein